MRRILCNIGLHRWFYYKEDNGFALHIDRSCRRCGKHQWKRAYYTRTWINDDRPHNYYVISLLTKLGVINANRGI